MLTLSPEPPPPNGDDKIFGSFFWFLFLLDDHRPTPLLMLRGRIARPIGLQFAWKYAVESYLSI